MALLRKTRPFLKWAGGKRSIIKSLTESMPKEYGDYYEPFLGGGSLFFEVFDDSRKYFLSDTNEELINCYEVILEHHIQLIERLEEYQKNHCKDFYYKIRSDFYVEKIERAARFLYLMKTCFNGLYRVNSKNLFNTPMGSYINPNICDSKNINLVHNILNKQVELKCYDYSHIKPNKKDFVYLDPPYHKIKKDSFTSYSTMPFLEDEQVKLKDFCVDLDRKGVYWMLSNSNTEFISELYKDFNQSIVKVPRYINSVKEDRKGVEELIIKNY